MVVIGGRQEHQWVHRDFIDVAQERGLDNRLVLVVDLHRSHVAIGIVVMGGKERLQVARIVK